MAIRKDQSGLSRTSRRMEARPPDAPRIFPRVLDLWWKRWQEREGFKRPMALEDREYRGSWSGIRCDRALWYAVTGQPESEPAGPAAHWRMATGQMVHTLLDDDVEAALKEVKEDIALSLQDEFDDVFPEYPVDLRPIGVNGASSGDLVAFSRRRKEIVACEVKSKGGYKFKLCTMDWKGGPLGPEYGDATQGALVAAALKEKFPDHTVECRVIYVALELISENMASKNDIDEYGKFLAEWVLQPDEVDLLVSREVERANRVLGEVMVPTRTIDDVDVQMPVRRMQVTNIEKGTTVGDLDGAVVYGSTWRCGYCRWRGTCDQDG